MNKLYQEINANQITQNLSSTIKPIKQLANTVKMAQNPQLFLQNMINQNPQMKEVMQLVNNSGKSPKELFYTMAKQKGVDPEIILRELR